MTRGPFVALCLCLCCSPWQARAGRDQAFKLSDEEKQVLDLTNAERQKEKLPPLKPNPILFKVARGHSENMARQGKMEHVLDGKTPFDRLKAAGYKYAKGGENIAAGDEKIPFDAVMKAWMESKVHRENILYPDFTEIGLGLVHDGKGKLYYTQVFARPFKH